MSPGDVYVTNDPYRGGSHLPDVTVVTPVHHRETGELLFFTASRAHHAEIGGIVPGSMPPFSTRLSEEGVLIRNFKLVDGGNSREARIQGAAAVRAVSHARRQRQPGRRRRASRRQQQRRASNSANWSSDTRCRSCKRTCSTFSDAAAEKMRLALARISRRPLSAHRSSRRRLADCGDDHCRRATGDGRLHRHRPGVANRISTRTERSSPRRCCTSFAA